MLFLTTIFISLPVYKLTIHVNEEDDGKPLCITHTPPMSADECRKVGLTIQVSTLGGGGDE